MPRSQPLANLAYQIEQAEDLNALEECDLASIDHQITETRDTTSALEYDWTVSIVE